MKENVGRIDRIARAVLGPALFTLGYTRLGGHAGRPAGLAAMLTGFAIVDSAITRVCPLNVLLGIDTRTRRERERDQLSSPIRQPRTERAAEDAMAEDVMDVSLGLGT
jgi:hypothetical protein